MANGDIVCQIHPDALSDLLDELCKHREMAEIHERQYNEMWGRLIRARKTATACMNCSIVFAVVIVLLLIVEVGRWLP